MAVIDTGKADGATLDKSLIDKISLHLLPFMLVLYIVSYLDRINISFAALEMNKSLQLSDEVFGFGAGVFFFGYCLFGIPSNLIIQKFGPRRWVASIMIAWGFMTVGFCFVKTPLQFCVLRFLLGIAEAGFFPGMLLYLTYWFPARYYGMAVARFMTAIPLAGLLGSGTAAAALSMTGMHGLAGWMWLFIVTGIPAVILGTAVLKLLPDNPRQASWLSQAEADAISVSVGSSRPGRKTKNGEADADEKEARAAFMCALTDLKVWHFALLYFTLTVSMYGFQLWLPQIIKTFQTTNNSMIALLSAVPAVFQALGMLIIARNSDKTGERRMHVVLASGLTFCGLILSCTSPVSWLKLIGLCIAAFGIWGSVGPFWALSNDSLKRESQATGIAIINSVGNLGGFAGPFIVGLVKGGGQGFSGSLIALAIASVLAMILAYGSKKS